MSLLQLILKAQDPDESLAKTRRMLNQFEVQSEVKMAMLAGYETTSTPLTWFCLVQHPHVQE
jgi:cytochrome P450